MSPTTPPSLYPIQYDLSNCDEEPIHLIRSYQLPAVLLVCREATGEVVANSENATALWGRRARALLGTSVWDLLSTADQEVLDYGLSVDNLEAENPLFMGDVRGEGFAHGANLVAHRNAGLLYLEFEPLDAGLSQAAFLHRVDKSLQRVQRIDQEDTLFSSVVREVKALTKFDRVMLYQFDDEYNGEVVAEAREEEMEPFLHLRYPHTDIPKQARELFLRNQFRHTVSTAEDGSTGIVLSPELGQLDLGNATNRGVSPIHLKYLRNMGVGASLNIAIVVHRKLWGLIACHHRTEKFLDYRLRSMLGFMGKVVSGHLALWQSTDFRNRILQTSITRSHLFERMTENFDIVQGVTNGERELLKLTDSTGAAMFLDGEFYRFGRTPEETELHQTLDFLRTIDRTSYATHQLYEELPAARGFSEPVAGLLSIRLTENPGEYIIWFRPEIIQTINWGGRPDQRKEVVEGKVQLHPNLSFQRYAEKIRGVANPWLRHQIDGALALRNDIKEVILQKYKEATRLNGQLVNAYEELESFSYTVSHDLRAPLRTIKGFAEILEEDYHEQLDDEGRSALQTIVSSVGKMNQFINDILSFSRLGRTELQINDIVVEDLVREIWTEVTIGHAESELSTALAGLSLPGDHVQMRQLFLNLLSNAVKYSSKGQVARVAVEGHRDDDFITVTVRDNGIGFDMNYAERIFAVFNRLVTEDQYPGTGVGLAIAKRIMDKHHGTISVDSEPGQGAAFTVKFPVDLRQLTTGNQDNLVLRQA